MAELLRFDADNPDTYADLAAGLRSQLQAARAEWVENRGDADVEDRHNAAMDEYAAARRHLREVGIAVGQRTVGMGVTAIDNTEGA
jgi:hypothetical protein